MERKKVCGLVDFQKPSREACAQAAQNDRLPVQTVVQVLYCEQQRFRDATNGGPQGGHSPALPYKVNVFSSDIISDELSSLRRENQDLKLELVKMKMKMKLKEIETSANRTAIGSPMSPADIPPLPRRSFIYSVSKMLGRVYPLVPNAKIKPNNDRRS